MVPRWEMPGGRPRCVCGIRERAAGLRRGGDVLAVADLGWSNRSGTPWKQDGGSGPAARAPRAWAVNYLIEWGWFSHEVIHLFLEHGRWREMGKEGAPARVRAFVRDVFIGAVDAAGRVARLERSVMRDRDGDRPPDKKPRTVRDLLEKLEEEE